MSQELPEPEGEGWDAEVRITKRDLHGLLNQHGAVVRAELRAAVEGLWHPPDGRWVDRAAVLALLSDAKP